EGRDRIGWVETLVVAPTHRRRGGGRALLAAIADVARRRGRDRLSTAVPVTHSAGTAFAAALGGDPGLVEQQNRLAVADLDRAMLEQWMDRAAERAAGYSLIRFDDLCPDEWLDQFADLIAVMNSAPRREGADEVRVTAVQVRSNELAHVERGHVGWTV